jgi:acetylornithine deacetylase/succinyl-diaminopimelate desuccinylase-like protein
MVSQDVKQKVQTQIDALHDELIELVCGVVNVPSPPGHERAVCEWIADWLAQHGLEGYIQEVEPTRANVVGRLPGTGGGKSLLFNSHMDTTFTGDPEEDLYILGRKEFMTPPQAEIRDGKIIGLGAYNDKGPLVPAIIAARAIQRSGVRLQGDVLLTGVAGEIGRGQVWPHTGPHTRGKGVGARHLIANGVWADYVIVAEASEFSVSWGLPGAAYFRITTRGVSRYAPTNVDRRSATPAENRNAIIKMAHLIPHIEAWADVYEAENTYPLGPEGGVIEPKVTIGAIEGGVSTKPNWRPAVCFLYLDVRIPPNRTPLDVKREVEKMVKGTGLSNEVFMYLSHRGYVSPPGYEVVAETIKKYHQEVLGAPPNPPGQADTSMWNDSNVFYQFGIPGVKYGPARPGGERFPETILIQDLMDIAKVYALTCLEICGVEDTGS